jgi:hypothetical protein
LHPWLKENSFLSSLWLALLDFDEDEDEDEVAFCELVESVDEQKART